MSYVQVKDALTAIRTHYGELASRLERFPKGDDQATEFARRVVKAERRMDKAVSSLEGTASEATLNTWLQFFPDNELVPLRNGAQQPTSINDLLDYYRDFNKQLVELFELISRSTECEATCEIFELLSAVEQQNARDLGWAARGPV